MSKAKAPAGQGDKPAPAAEPTRAERLAAALRANLQRRKAQIRGRAAKREPEPKDS